MKHTDGPFSMSIMYHRHSAKTFQHKTISRGRMSPRPVGMRFQEGMLGQDFLVAGNVGPFGLDPRFVYENGWAGRAADYTQALDLTGAPLALLWIPTGNTWHGGDIVDENEQYIRAGDPGNETSALPDGVSSLPIPFHAELIRRSRGGQALTHPFYLAMSDLDAYQDMLAALKSKVDSNARALGFQEGQLLVYFGQHHDVDWDEFHAFKDLSEITQEQVIREMLQPLKDAGVTTAFCDSLSGTAKYNDDGSPTSAYRFHLICEELGLKSGCELWPAEGDGVGNLHKEWAHWGQRPSSDGIMLANIFWNRNQPGFFVPPHQVQGNLFLIGQGKRNDSNPFFKGDLIYNPGNKSPSYASYITDRNNFFIEAVTMGVHVITTDSDWTYTGLRSQGVVK